MCSHGSSSRRSSTPQVKAPCAPPPCSAKSTRTGAWSDVAVLVVISGHRCAELGTRRADQDSAGGSCQQRKPSVPILRKCLEAGGDYDDKFRASNGPREKRRTTSLLLRAALRPGHAVARMEPKARSRASSTRYGEIRGWCHAARSPAFRRAPCGYTCPARRAGLWDRRLDYITKS
jgi:hypothetical protein